MQWELHPQMNAKLYLKNPDQTETGRKIIGNGITLLKNLGLELFTFKKLADRIGVTEATVYRYFENKYKLLNYLVCWYWHWMDYQVMFNTKNLSDDRRKIEIAIEILTGQSSRENFNNQEINFEDLHEITIAESSKVYLTKHVNEDNAEEFFMPFKSLCNSISELFVAYNPQYQYPKSLASTLIEMAQYQDFFMNHLPSLTDFGSQKDKKSLKNFLGHLVFSALEK